MIQYRRIKIAALLLGLLLSSCAPTPSMPENYIDQTYSEIRALIEEESNVIFYAGTDQCSICKEYKEVLRTYLPNHSSHRMIYLNMQQISSLDYLELFNEMNDYLIANDRDDNLQGGERYFGVPTTFGYQNGELVYVKMGLLSENQLNTLYDELLN
jgi:hypothetical protein